MWPQTCLLCLAKLLPVTSNTFRGLRWKNPAWAWSTTHRPVRLVLVAFTQPRARQSGIVPRCFFYSYERIDVVDVECILNRRSISGRKVFVVQSSGRELWLLLCCLYDTGYSRVQGNILDVFIIYTSNATAAEPHSRAGTYHTS